MSKPTNVADLTFAALVELEPGLARLEKEIRHASHLLGQQPRVCANSMWYGRGLVGFKEKLNLLVGWHRERSHADASAEVTLQSETAYDLACKHLHSLLPKCRGCACSLTREVPPS